MINLSIYFRYLRTYFFGDLAELMALKIKIVSMI